MRTVAYASMACAVAATAALLALLAAAPGADAELISVPAAPPATEVKDGWYFREAKINVRPGWLPPGWLGPGLLSRPDEEQLRNFPDFNRGSLSLLGDEAKINVICPRGYKATACIGGTVPASIGNIQYAGGLATEGPLPGLARGVDEVNSGFNEYTGCLTSVRFDTALDIDKVYRYGGHVFVKAEAYCEKEKEYPPVHPPVHPPYDPCDCSQQHRSGNYGGDSGLGCTNTNACHTGTVCYVGQHCPGFQASQNPFRKGQFYKCVYPTDCV